MKSQQKILNTGLRWLWVTVIVLSLDRFTKSLALHFLEFHQPHPVIPFFNFTLAYNKGAAFSFLNTASGWQVWFFGVLALSISAVLLVWLKRLRYQQWWVSIALSCIIGGALGNLWDRIAYGYVIDFIELYISYWHWPVFNLADTAICLGATMLVLEAIFKRK